MHVMELYTADWTGGGGDVRMQEGKESKRDIAYRMMRKLRSVLRSYFEKL
jgi:hypothetical protein